MTQATRAILRYGVYGIKTDYSDYSKLACDYMEAAPDGPNPPSSVNAAGALSCIVVSWIAPTENADGSDLSANKILGYNVYIKAGSAPTKLSYDSSVFVTATTYVYTINSTTDTYFVITTVNTDEEESEDSLSSHDEAELRIHGETPAPEDPTGGLYIAADYMGYYDSIAGEWVAYIRNNGDFFLGGAAGKLQWDYSETELIVEGTYKSSDGFERIEISGNSLATAHWVIAYDSSNKGRAGIYNSGIYVWNSLGIADGNRIVYFPSVASTDAFVDYDNFIVNNTLIVGRDDDPETADDLYVDGAARFGSAAVAGVLTVGDHGTATSAQVVGICYGTGSPPSASGVPEGTLFICYEA